MIPAFYKRVLPLVKRPGGKSRMLKVLMPVINSIDHTIYCELFCGGAAVLLARQPGAREIINDIDGDIINLYRQAKHHRLELMRTLRLMPESRELFQQQLEIMRGSSATEIQRAAAFAYVNFYCFAADNKTFGIKRTGFSTRSFLDRKLIGFSRRLDRVTIERTSYEHCLALYDSYDTLFFCDPPYTKCGQIGAYDAWTIDDATKLRDTLAKSKGRYVITLNDCPDNRALFKGHRIIPVRTHAAMRNKTSPGSTFGEIIIISPQKKSR